MRSERGAPMDFVITSIMLGLVIAGMALIGVGILGEPTFRHQVEPFSWRIRTTQMDRPSDTRRQRARMIIGGSLLIVGAVALGLVAL